jgi:hypothetical protein
MKRSFAVAVMAAVVLVAAPVALVGAGESAKAKKHGWKVFTARGVVTTVDAENDTFTMEVKNGKRMRSQRGQEIIVQVNDATKIYRVLAGERTAVELADMKVGERVWTKGTFVKSDGSSIYTAKRVKLKASWPFMVKGAVTAVDCGANGVTVQVTRSMRAMRAYVGDEVTLQTTDATKFRKCVDGVTTTITCAEIAVEDVVVVNGSVDNTEPTDRIFVVRRLLVKG